MRRALQRTGYAEEETEEAVGRLRREGLLDDRRFAAAFATSRMAHSGLGRRRVLQALRLRGVAPRVADAGLSEALRDLSETDVLDRLARRRWRQRADAEPEQRLRGLWRFLLGRGFPPDLVRQRLNALWPRYGDALAGLEPLAPEDLEASD